MKSFFGAKYEIKTADGFQIKSSTGNYAVSMPKSVANMLKTDEIKKDWESDNNKNELYNLLLNSLNSQGISDKVRSFLQGEIQALPFSRDPYYILNLKELIKANDDTSLQDFFMEEMIKIRTEQNAASADPELDMLANNPNIVSVHAEYNTSGIQIRDETTYNCSR